MAEHDAKTNPSFTTAQLHVVCPGVSDAVPERIFVWAHGWQRSHTDFLPFAESLHGLGAHYLLDLPGFGQTPRPPETWGTAAYADFLADWLKTLPAGVPIYWVGHSFGCRVGLRLAAQYPHLLSGLFLVAAPGLRQPLPIAKRSYRWLKTRLYKLLKHMLPVAWLQPYFGSEDYKNAGHMRDILVATVRENLAPVVPHITCPVYFAYGEKDTAASPQIGAQFIKLIKNARMHVVPGADHFSLLGAHRHQVLAQLKQWVMAAKT